MHQSNFRNHKKTAATVKRLLHMIVHYRNILPCSIARAATLLPDKIMIRNNRHIRKGIT